MEENSYCFAEFHSFPLEHEISLQFSRVVLKLYFNDVRAAFYCQAHN